MNEKSRIYLGWGIGIVAFLVIFYVFILISDIIGIPLDIDNKHAKLVYDSSIDDYRDTEGDFTGLGLSLSILSVMFASRFGMAAYKGKLSGGISKEKNIDFFVWATGIFLYGVQNGAFFHIFEGKELGFFSFIRTAIDLAAAVGIYFFLKIWRDKKLLSIHKKE